METPKNSSSLFWLMTCWKFPTLLKMAFPRDVAMMSSQDMAHNVLTGTSDTLLPGLKTYTLKLWKSKQAKNPLSSGYA